MSIQTDLTRITNAKAAIKAAIEGKGVTVPDGTLLDGMAALIESIEAGGGGATGITTGVYIPASTGYDNVITHGLGVIPKLFAICAGSQAMSGSYILDSAHGFSDRKLLFRMSRASAGNSPSGYIETSYDITKGAFPKRAALAKANDTTINVGGNYQLTAGIEYYWFALA